MRYPIRISLAITALVALLIGYAALLSIVPDMARHSNQPIHLAGANGPLSAEQSKKILARLNNGDKPTSIFDRHLALEEAIVGSPLVVGQ